jgi:type I restriction enzyme S subunit
MSWQDGEAPDGWELRRLGDVTKVVGGGTPSTGTPANFADSGGHPWITPADLTDYDGKYIGRGRRNLTDQGLAASSATYMPAGTVLFSSRAPVGYVAIASNPVTTNQGFRSFVPSDQIDSEYLYYALRFLRPVAEQLASGTTFAELSGSKAANMKVAYPPLDQQRAIAKFLDRANQSERAASSHLLTARRLVERLRQVVLAAACSGRLTADWRKVHANATAPADDLAKLAAQKKQRSAREQPVDLGLPDLPSSYLVSRIGEAATHLEYGTSQRATALPGKGIPVLRMGNIRDGQLDLTDLKFIASSSEIVRLLLEPGDLLFNRTNSPELVGKSAVYRGETPTTFASYLIRVRFHPEVAIPEFANYWINSAWGRAWANLAKTDGVSQSNINGSKLSLMPIPLPPIEEQRVIVVRATQLLATATRLLGQVDGATAALDRSSRAILAKAFRGDLHPLEGGSA